MTLLTDLWAEALERQSETLWHSLPDRWTETVPKVMDDDLKFLVEALKRTRVEAVAAVRILTSLVEDGLVNPDILLLLRGCLVHQHPAVRLVAAEGLWRLADREAVTLLRVAVERETVRIVRETMAHVLGLLETK